MIDNMFRFYVLSTLPMKFGVDTYYENEMSL